MKRKLVMALMVVAIAALGFGPAAPPAISGDTTIPGSRIILRSGVDPASQARWQLVQADKLRHRCIDVVFHSWENSVLLGAFGGCGGTETPLLSGEGGVAERDPGLFHHGAYGFAPADVVTVRVTLTNGTVVTDTPTGGFWVAIWNEAAELIRVDALSASGRVIATVPPLHLQFA